jgi:putative DNA primase/helicase
MLKVPLSQVQKRKQEAIPIIQKWSGAHEGRIPDTMVANIAARVLEGHILFDVDRNKWLFWNGQIWTTEHSAQILFGLVMTLIQELVLPNLQGAPSPHIRSGLLAHSYTNSVLKAMRMTKRLAVSRDYWDTDPFLLNTPDGVVDLRSGHIRPATPADRLTLITGCGVAKKGAKMPRFNKFIQETTQGDAELERFLRMWFGVSLIGNVRDQKIVFIWGPGANGKSVLIRLTGLVGGGYHTTCSPSLFLSRKISNTDGPSPGLAKILPVRMVTGMEIPPNGEWNTLIIKMLCSDEPIAARFLFENEFELAPRCSITLGGNEQPTFTGLDDAIRRRFVLVNLTRVVPEKDRVPDLGRELFEMEGPAILRWMIDGAVERENRGFVTPASVAASSDAYFAEEDLVTQFVAEHCETGSEKRAGSTALYVRWKTFCQDRGRQEGSQKGLALRLQALGFTSHKDRKGLMGFKGLTLKDWQPPES